MGYKFGKGASTLSKIDKWFFRFGKAPRRRERHIKSQMKFFGGPKFKKQTKIK